MIKSLILEMRIRQWSKNLLVFAAILFGGNLFKYVLLYNVVLAFVAFCFISSGVYIINDIFDIEKDRVNPKKCTRPIASGALTKETGYIYASALFFLGLGIAYYLDMGCFLLATSYVVINLLYTVYLKNVVIIDVMVIAYGFVIRAVAGAVSIHSNMTMWFVLCVMFLSVFLALGKRRHELVSLQKNNLKEGRKVLQYYSVELINQMMTIVTAALLICYSLFTLDQTTQSHQEMFYTIPIVTYGMFYYLYFVSMKNGGAAPDEALYKEKPILFTVLIYIVLIIFIRDL